LPPFESVDGCRPDDAYTDAHKGIPGHQLHYDTDEQSLETAVVGGARHPEYSTIMFLEGNKGGVTFIANRSTAPTGTGDARTFHDSDGEYDPEEDPHNMAWAVTANPSPNRTVANC